METPASLLRKRPHMDYNEKSEISIWTHILSGWQLLTNLYHLFLILLSNFRKSIWDTWNVIVKSVESPELWKNSLVWLLTEPHVSIHSSSSFLVFGSRYHGEILQPLSSVFCPCFGPRPGERPVFCITKSRPTKRTFTGQKSRGFPWCLFPQTHIKQHTSLWCPQSVYVKF